MKSIFLAAYFGFFTIIGMITFSSCEEIVTPPDIENIEDKLVVNSILSPEDSVYIVEVTISSPSFGTLPDFDDDYVTDATVSISDGNMTGIFIYDSQLRVYQLQADMFPIETGTTYVLSVSAKGMSVSATCSTETPLKQLESYEINSNNSLVVNWRDTENRIDHYQVEAALLRDEGEFTNTYPYYFENDIISDNSRDGNILRATGEGFDRPGNGDTLRIIVYRFDELYADYFTILDNYYGDDPFSQPVQLPGNIDGGLGIFSIVQPFIFETVISE